MEPTVRTEHCDLYLGDNRELFPLLPLVDVTITDPPYGETTHQGARGGNGDTVLIDFAHISLADFLAVGAELVRLTRRWVVMTCEWRHAAKIEESALPLIRLGVWVKPNAAPQFTGDRPGTGWEAVAILHRSGRKRWNAGGHHAVWLENIEQGPHPTQKPLKLIRKWVRQFSYEGETIFDPFMGSGTTAVACIQTGRRFVGCEVRPDYFEMAIARIQHAEGVGGLFAPATKKADLFATEATA